MATPTYVALTEIQLASTTSSVTLAGFSQGYRDLVIVYNGTTSGNIGVSSKINGDSSLLSRVFMYGSGTTTDSGTGGPAETLYSSTTITTATVQLMDYSATDKHKSILSRSGAAGVISLASALRWASTDAITSISFTPNSGTFSSGSTFRIFGIEA